MRVHNVLIIGSFALSSLLTSTCDAQRTKTEVCSQVCDRSNAGILCDPTSGITCPFCRIPKRTSTGFDCYDKDTPNCKIMFGAPAPDAVDCENVPITSSSPSSSAPTPSVRTPSTSSSKPSTNSPTTSATTQAVDDTKAAGSGGQSFFASTMGIVIIAGGVIAVLVSAVLGYRYFQQRSERSDSESSRAFFASPKTKQKVPVTPDTDRTPLATAPYQAPQQRTFGVTPFYGHPDPSPVKSDGTLYGVLPAPPPHVAAQQAADVYGQDEVTLADRIQQLRGRKASAESIELGLERVEDGQRESDISASEVDLDMIRVTRAARERAFSAESTEL